MQAAAAAGLLVPDWLSSKWPGIADIARTLHGCAAPGVDDFVPLAKAVGRLATDPRMERVWRELFKRERGQRVDREYTYRLNTKRLRAHPHWEVVEGRSQQSDERDRLQEQACMVLFSEAVGGSSLDRPGSRVRTLADVATEVDAFRRLATRLGEDAHECWRLGQGQFEKPLRKMAEFVSEQAERRLSVVKLRDGAGRDVPNPWIVEREGKASNDRRLRGLVIDMVITCRALFGKTLPGIIATIASVALDRKVTEATVRGIANGIDDPRT
jgi:hypothetical protein